MFASEDAAGAIHRELLPGDVAAIREALDDMVKGDRGIPFDQFDRDFRKRHNLPA